MRRYAAKHDTMVNALVRDYLTRLATQEDRAAKAREELSLSSRKPPKPAWGPIGSGIGKTFMKVDSFLDTNVLLYAASGRIDFFDKFKRAYALLAEENFGISAQVLQEFFVNVTNKGAMGPMPVSQAMEWIVRLKQQPCVHIDSSLVKVAIETSQQYRISYWNAAIAPQPNSWGLKHFSPRISIMARPMGRSGL